MAYDGLRDWLRALERADEVERVKAEVSPVLEMAAIADRAAKAGKGTKDAGGPALLFENVAGYRDARVLMNQFGSERRMKLALEVDSLDEIAGRIQTLLNPVPPNGLMDKLKLLPMLAEVGSFFPKVVKARQAPCKEVVLKGDAVDLLKFPVLTTWPGDGGPFITLPCVVTRDPKTGKRNVGMYRMQVYDGRTTGMHWQRQKVAAEHARERLRSAAVDASGAVDVMALTAGGTARAADMSSVPQTVVSKMRGERMEVAVAIGTDPATTFSAIVPAPPEAEEYLIAGFLRRKAVELVRCETVDLEVPAYAEIVLEGFVELGELRTEGPFGDHTGFYTMQDEYPVFHITCITHRKDPIYAATVVGKPPMEDAWMGKAVERIFLPLMRLTIPEIVDVNLPAEGVFHNLMILSIRKSYAGSGAQGDERDLGAGAGDVYQVHRCGGRGLRCAGPRRGDAAGGEQHRSGAGHSVHAGAGGLAGSRVAAAELWQQDGDRCDAEVGGGGIHTAVAADADDAGYGEEEGGGRL